MPNPSKFSDRVTLKAVVTKIKTIANEKYHDKVYENILPIFNSLTTVEKRTLLRGLINVCFIVEDRIIVDSKALVDVKQAVETVSHNVDTQIKTIEEFNKAELIKLKTWVTKAVVVASLIGLIVVSAVFVMASSGKIENFAVLETLMKIISVMFGGGDK